MTRAVPLRGHGGPTMITAFVFFDSEAGDAFVLFAVIGISFTTSNQFPNFGHG
jgi:hypothetical protein